jgi:hypothetical protein
MRRHLTLLALLPLLLGSQCPSSEYDDRWVVVDVQSSRAETNDPPPTQRQQVRVRFHRETASHDLDLDAGVLVEPEVLAPDEAEQGLARTSSPADATLLLTSMDPQRSITLHAGEGAPADQAVPPGTYDVTVIPDEYKHRYTMAYEQVTIPGDDLTGLEVDWGYPLTAGIVEYDITNLADPILGLGDMEVEVFTEVAPGRLRRAGPRDTTDTGGEFTLYLPEGSYTFRISSRLTADRPFPVGLVTHFRVPEDMEALQAEAEAQGEDTPIFYAYPRFERRSLSGRLVASGPLGSEEPEGNVNLVAWSVVEAPTQYVGSEVVDFTIGVMRRRTYSTDTGDFHFGQEDAGLPAGVYSLDVVPGFYSDASAERWDGELAVDLTEDGAQLGEIALDSRVHLHLRVEDEGGDEVEGARVEVHNLGISGYVTAVNTGTTASDDAPGTVRVFVEQGPHRVVVVPPEGSSLARTSFDLEISPTVPPTVVRLEEGIEVTGQVSMDAQLVGGVQVRFSDPDTGEILGVGTARSSGTFELTIPTSWVWDDLEGGDDDSAP